MDAATEDVFCKRLLGIGATLWPSEQEQIDVQVLDNRPQTEAMERQLILDWPATGGLWMLIFPIRKNSPKDFGKMHTTLLMEERCAVTRS